MLSRLLFVILLGFFNASKSVYKKYNMTNFYKKKSSGFSISDAFGALAAFSGEAAPAAALTFVGAAILHQYFIMKNDEEFQREWESEKNNMTKDEIDKLKNYFEDFSKQLENLDEKIYEQEFKELNSIFEKEKKVIVNDYIIDFISSDIIQKNLESITRLNILCLGKSQIGKTTLINEILLLPEDKKGKTGGKAESVTMEDTPYISDKLKHIKIIDSRGMESGNFSLKNFSERYRNKMLENTKYGNYNDLIHCIWYCVSGNLMNKEEIHAIRQIHSLFDKFKVPIIFVYLKPFNSHDVNILKNQTSQINNNFIAVQTIHHIDECKKDDINCMHEKQEFKPKNMDVLLQMTKNLSLEGIKNSVSSRTSFYLIDKIEKMLEERFEKKSEEFENLLESVEKYIKDRKTKIDLNRLNDVREENILKIIEVIEETLFKSKKKLSKEGRDIIYSIQKKIENLYQEKYSSIYQERLSNFYSLIAKKKKILHDKHNDNTLLGCNDLKNSDLYYDFEKTEESFDSNYIVQIYSMIASFETINKKVKNHILFLLKSKIDKIIADKNLLEKLEKKIQMEAEKGTKNLIEYLDYEINKEFSEKTIFQNIKYFLFDLFY